MTIIEALVQLRNDLKLWVTNNLRVKMDKNLGTEESGKFLAVDENGDIGTVEINATVDELNYMSGVTSSVQEQLDAKVGSSHTHDNYLESSDIEGLATEEYVATKIAEAQLAESDVDLSGYYTKTETDTKIEEAVDAIEHPTVDLTPYATTEYVNTELAKKSDSSHTHDASEVGAKASGDVESIATGGTGATDAATALSNLGALPLAGGTMQGQLHMNSNNLWGVWTLVGCDGGTYGDELPDAGIAGRIFFKKV